MVRAAVQVSNPWTERDDTTTPAPLPSMGSPRVPRDALEPDHLHGRHPHRVVQDGSTELIPPDPG